MIVQSAMKAASQTLKGRNTGCLTPQHALSNRSAAVYSFIMTIIQSVQNGTPFNLRNLGGGRTTPCDIESIAIDAAGMVKIGNYIGRDFFELVDYIVLNDGRLSIKTSDKDAKFVLKRHLDNRTNLLGYTWYGEPDFRFEIVRLHKPQAKVA